MIRELCDLSFPHHSCVSNRWEEDRSISVSVSISGAISGAKDSLLTKPYPSKAPESIDRCEQRLIYII